MYHILLRLISVHQMVNSLAYRCACYCVIMRAFQNAAEQDDHSGAKNWERVGSIIIFLRNQLVKIL